MIGAIAVDDEPKAIAVIESHVSKLDNLQLITHFYDPEKAIDFLRQNPVDLIFLDINMPKMSGLELLRELRLPPEIIFTTAYSKFALDSYSHNAVDYLLKPFAFERFKVAVQRAEQRLSGKRMQQAFFFIKDGYKNIKVFFEDILCITGSGNYLDIHAREKSYSSRMTFTDIAGKVPSSQFLRVHHSHMVRIEAIEKIENNHIFIGQHKIPIGSRYKETFLKRLDIN